MKGLEPPRREAPDPKSGVATNYTTSALFKELLTCCFVVANIEPFYFTNQIFFKTFLYFFSTSFLDPKIFNLFSFLLPLPT